MSVRDFTQAFRLNLVGSITYELLHVLQLFILFTTTRLEMSSLAVALSLATLCSKIIDLGAGTASVRWLRPSPKKNDNLFDLSDIVPLLTIQSGILFICLSIVLYFFTPCWDVYAFIFVISLITPPANFCRHIVHARLEAHQLVYVEILLKGLLIMVLASLSFFKILSLHHAMGTLIIFELIITIILIRMAYPLLISHAQTWNNNFFLKMKATLAVRLPIFSTKIARDLVSSHVLTPFFAYTCGLHHAGIFYLLSSLAGSCQSVAKMALGYTTAGIALRSHDTLPLRLIFHHIILCFSMAIASYLFLVTYISYTSPSLLGASMLLPYTLCFATNTVLEIFFIPCEQLYVASGKYKIFHFHRMAELCSYALFFFLISIQNILPALCGALLVKAGIITSLYLLLFLSNHRITEPETPTPVKTPTFFPPTVAHTPVPHPRAHAPTRSSANGWGSSGGVKCPGTILSWVPRR